MKDDSITPDQPSDSASDSKIYVNLDSLSASGGDGGSVAPEIGDEVEFTVKGNVASVEGSVACVTPTEVNGEPAPSSPNDKSDTDDLESEGNRLRDKLEGSTSY
jgi:hypothetical protein